MNTFILVDESHDFCQYETSIIQVNKTFLMCTNEIIVYYFLGTTAFHFFPKFFLLHLYKYDNTWLKWRLI